MSDSWSDDDTAAPAPMNPPRGGGSRTCYRCGELGHMSRECPEGFGGVVSGGGSRACYKCGGEGHMSRECPYSGGGGSGGGTVICYKCGKEGHRGRDCRINGGVFRVEVNRAPARSNNICSKTTQVLEEAAEAAVDLLLALNAAKRVAWERNNRVLKMASGLLPLLTGTRNSIRQETANALEKKDQVRQEGHSSRDRANGDRPGRQGAGTERHVPPQKTLQGTPVITGDAVAHSVNTFQQLKLEPLLLENVRKCGFKNPTLIQKHVSPQLLAGRDVLCCAQPGSGKTTAFLLPIINALLDRKAFPTSSVGYPARPQALILVPTGELATEIGNLANMLAIGSILRIQVLSGAASFSSPQTKFLIGCNILIATTERLKNFVRADIVDLSKVRYFILDDADRLLDIALPADVTEILAKLPPKKDRISGIFSATFSNQIQLAAGNILNNHVYIGPDAGPCRNVQQEILKVDKSWKGKKVAEILKDLDPKTKAVVFRDSKKGSDSLLFSLSAYALSYTHLHGNSHEARERSLRDFTVGKRQILVATSVKAVDLDIPNVGLVVNYDLPSHIDEYLARIGLIGRQGPVGRAVSFYDENQDAGLRSSLVTVLKGVGQAVPDFLDGGSKPRGWVFQEGASPRDPVDDDDDW